MGCHWCCTCRGWTCGRMGRCSCRHRVWSTPKQTAHLRRRCSAPLQLHPLGTLLSIKKMEPSTRDWSRACCMLPAALHLHSIAASFGWYAAGNDVSASNDKEEKDACACVHCMSSEALHGSIHFWTCMSDALGVTCFQGRDRRPALIHAIVHSSPQPSKPGEREAGIISF